MGDGPARGERVGCRSRRGGDEEAVRLNDNVSPIHSTTSRTYHSLREVLSIKVRIHDAEVAVPPAMEGEFIHDLPPFLPHAPAAVEDAAVGVERRDGQPEAVEERHWPRERLLQCARHCVNVERQQEAEGPHGEGQDRRALAMREEVGDVQHCAVPAECEDQVRVRRQQRLVLCVLSI